MKITCPRPGWSTRTPRSHYCQHQQNKQINKKKLYLGQSIGEQVRYSIFQLFHDAILFSPSDERLVMDGQTEGKFSKFQPPSAGSAGEVLLHSQHSCWFFLSFFLGHFQILLSLRPLRCHPDPVIAKQSSTLSGRAHHNRSLFQLFRYIPGASLQWC